MRDDTGKDSEKQSTSSFHRSLSSQSLSDFTSISEDGSSDFVCDDEVIPLELGSTFRDAFGSNLFFNTGSYRDPEALHSCIVVNTSDGENFSHTHLTVETSEEATRKKVRNFVADLVKCWHKLKGEDDIGMIEASIIAGRGDGETGQYANTLLTIIKKELLACKDITFEITYVDPLQDSVSKEVISSAKITKIKQQNDKTGQLIIKKFSPFSLSDSTSQNHSSKPSLR